LSDPLSYLRRVEFEQVVGEVAAEVGCGGVVDGGGLCMLIDPEPLIPTHGYRVLCQDATLIDLEAEGHVADGHPAGVPITTLVIRPAGAGRGAAVQAGRR
jgi:hypothetical protein